MNDKEERNIGFQMSIKLAEYAFFTSTATGTAAILSWAAIAASQRALSNKEKLLGFGLDDTPYFSAKRSRLNKAMFYVDMVLYTSLALTLIASYCVGFFG
jgi:hypothetical protein